MRTPALPALAILLLAAACSTTAATLPISAVVPPGTADFALDPVPVPAEAALEDAVAPLEPGSVTVRALAGGAPESFEIEVREEGGRARVLIAAADEAGRRWARTALRQLTVVHDGRTFVRLGRIRDRPAFPYRGSKRPRAWEALYRANFTHEGGDDPELLAAGRVHFVLVLSPGGTLDATESGLAAAERFFREGHARGARLFAIEFDDVGYDLTEATRARFGRYTQALAHYLRECRRLLRGIDPAAVLYWLPQTYWTDHPKLAWFGNELGLAGGIPEDLGLIVTGPEVISPTVTRADLAHARSALHLTRTRALVYDNLGREGDHGPLTGRAPDLYLEADAVFGERGEVLNRITRLDYAWNPRAYDPARSHLLACREVVGAAAARPLSRLILTAETLTPAERRALYREVVRLLDPPPGAPVDAEAYLRRVKRAKVDSGSGGP